MTVTQGALGNRGGLLTHLPAWPKVTVIIPVLNEERYLPGCLESILQNDYPKSHLEILVVDGGSKDRSRNVVETYAQRCSVIRLLDNPRRIVSTAMNIGIREARGEVIIRMDAHARYEPDYIRQCVELLQSTGAANVGGLQRAIGTSYVGRVIAAAITHPFGAGDARFRYSEVESYVDTVYLGAWFKRTLESVDGFNEEWVVNQDAELNCRLRRHGGRVLLSPRVRCEYYVRESFRALARQYFRYGFWRAKTVKAYPESVRWRQLVPPAFVLALGCSLAMAPWVGSWVLTLPGFYLLIDSACSMAIAQRRGWQYLLALPFVFPVLHISWGSGFLIGLCRFGLPRLSRRWLYKAFKPFEAC